MKVPFLDLTAQYAAIKQEVHQRLDAVLDSASFILGKQVEEFEEAFSRFLDSRYAIGVANGTDALTITLKALGIGPGDEVITAANSFVATAEAIVHAGARPVFVDIEPETYTLKIPEIKSKITGRTRAIVPRFEPPIPTTRICLSSLFLFSCIFLTKKSLKPSSRGRLMRDSGSP